MTAPPPHPDPIKFVFQLRHLTHSFNKFPNYEHKHFVRTTSFRFLSNPLEILPWDYFQ